MTHFSHSAISWLNQPTFRGWLANSGVALGAVLLVNGLIFGLGWTATTDPAHRSNAYELPGALVGTVWTLLFLGLGTARWLLNKSTGQERARWWVSGLLLNCLVYPFYSLALGSLYGGLAGNLWTIGLAGWVAARSWPYSPGAGILSGLVGIWVGLATYTIWGELGWLG